MNKGEWSIQYDDNSNNDNNNDDNNVKSNGNDVDI